MKLKFQFHWAWLSLLVLSGNPLAAVVKPQDADLWERSLAAISTNGLYLPRQFHYQTYVLDNTGRSFRSFKADCLIRWDGSVPSLHSSELIESSGIKRGEEEGKWENEISNTLQFLYLRRPFFIENPPVLIRSFTKPKFLDGVRCSGFEFEMEMDGLLVKGRSWIDPSDALPKQVELRIINFEYQNEDKKVIHYYRTIDYQIDEGIWTPCVLTESIWFTRRSMLKSSLFVEEKVLDLSDFVKSTL